MATKKKIKLEYNIIDNNSLYYNRVINFSYNTDCDNDSNSSYSNFKLKHINYFNLYEQISGKKKILNINDYCLDRFIRNILKQDAIEFYIEPGYYGGEAKFKVDQKVLDRINGFTAHLNINKDGRDNSLHIETVLISEYGFVLESLKNKIWELKEVELNFVQPNAGMKHVQQNVVEYYCADVELNKYNLTCLALQNYPYYRLIDGYHRYCAATQYGLKKITVISCKE